MLRIAGRTLPASGHPRRLTQGGFNVRPVEIATLEEQGLRTRLCQSVDRTIDDIQLSRISLPLAETAKRIEGGSRHFVVERHHDNPGILQ